MKEIQEMCIENALREIKRLNTSLDSLERIHIESRSQYHQMKDTLTRVQAEGTRLIAENRQLRETINMLTESK